MGEEGSARTPVAAHITLGGVPAVVCAACRTKRGVKTRSWGERVREREIWKRRAGLGGGRGKIDCAAEARVRARWRRQRAGGERAAAEKKSSARPRGAAAACVSGGGVGVGREVCGGKGEKGGKAPVSAEKTASQKQKTNPSFAGCRGAGCQLYRDTVPRPLIASSSLLGRHRAGTDSGGGRRRRRAARLTRAASPAAAAGGAMNRARARRAPRRPHPRRRP